MKFDYHIIVIGGGSAGLVVASGAAGLGARVALVEGNKMGGDCLNAGCVPSKSFLKSAHLAAQISESHGYGIDTQGMAVNLSRVMRRVSSVIAQVEPHDSKERYESLGVDVIMGYGVLEDRHTVTVGKRRLTARSIVIATGSSAFIPPIPGLSDVTYYTNRNIFAMNRLPDHLIVLGAGPIGCELGQGFRHLGSQVTLLDRADSLFTKDDPEVGPLMKKRFEDEGIQLLLGASVLEVKESGKTIEVKVKIGDRVMKLRGDALLVAVGRHPATSKLNLEALGIETGPRGHILVNERLQTKIGNIYAAGDVAGPYAFTHTAGYQAGIIIQNTIFPIKKKVDYRAVPWVTYTRPEVAHVGLTEAEAQRQNLTCRVYKTDMAANDRARAEGDVEGFLKVLTDKRGVVIGATMVGEKAGEQIGLANMAISRGLKISSFMDLIIPYPTELDVYKAVGLQALREGFKPWQKKLVEGIFLR